MAEENKTVNKQKIDINTYRFPSGQTIDEILKTQTNWSTDEQCLLNMIDSNWRAVDYFITDKEKELSKKFLLASNNPEVDLKLLAVQSEVATQYLCQKHTNQELWEKARNDPKGMTRPFSKDVVNIENQINFSYELPSWIKEHIEEIPNNWFQKTPAQIQKEQEREDILTTQAAITVGTSYEEWEEMLDDNQKADEIIENMQANGGISEAAIEADIQSQENPRPDYIDSDGIPHWNDEEEIDEPVDMAGYEFNDYIHSDEFIEKFGDWEKINRLEKLKESESLIIDDRIIIHGNDVTKRINELRNNPSDESLDELSDYTIELGKEMLQNLKFEQNISNYDNPRFTVKDDNKTYKFNFAGIKESSRHNLLQKGHIEGINNIPEIIQSAYYIGTEKNEDGKKPELLRFYYYGLGIKLNDEDYTAKVVFTERKNGEVYYDQSLSTIEKGKFVDLIKKEPDAVNRINRPDSNGFNADAVHPHKQGWNIINEYYDMRLYRICQVPQLPYLERNPITNKWQPKEETVRLVKQNLLHVEKKGQVYYMVDTSNSLNEHIHNLEQQLSEKDEELTIWIEKAQKSNVQISSLSNQLEKANKTIQQQNRTIQEQSKQIKEQDQLLNGKGSVKVNGIERTFEHGLKHAFPEAVKQLDIQIQINKDLTRSYNELVKSKSNNISPVSPSDDGNTYS